MKRSSKQEKSEREVAAPGGLADMRAQLEARQKELEEQEAQLQRKEEELTAAGRSLALEALEARWQCMREVRKGHGGAGPQRLQNQAAPAPSTPTTLAPSPSPSHNMT